MGWVYLGKGKKPKNKRTKRDDLNASLNRTDVYGEGSVGDDGSDYKEFMFRSHSIHQQKHEELTEALKNALSK